MNRYRVYADTSVFGGCFDEEFADESQKFFNDVKTGKFILVLSSETFRELNKAPEHVQQVLADIPPENLGSIADAEHIASASVAKVDFVVSWNFKHIVHYEKIHGFQAVNLSKNYKAIRIYSPKEVVES